MEFDFTFVTLNNCGSSSVGRARPCQGRGRGSESRFPLKIPKKRDFFLNRSFQVFAQVVELVDTKDLKSFDHCGRAGSSPAPGTYNKRKLLIVTCLQVAIFIYIQFYIHFSLFTLAFYLIFRDKKILPSIKKTGSTIQTNKNTIGHRARKN